MNNQPCGSDLLATARQLLLDELVPDLPPQARYKALMIASAMGVACREIEAGSTGDIADTVADFLAQAGIACDPATDGESVLAQAIRQRAVPQALQPSLVALLLAVTRGKLQISNPKYLDQ